MSWLPYLAFAALGFVAGWGAAMHAVDKHMQDRDFEQRLREWVG